jgi:oligopeptide/dipeptide ABC transporter ATP-binding protein
MGSLPVTHGKGEKLYTIPGLPPDMSRAMPGCPFAPRCEHAQDICRAGEVLLKPIAENHESACVRVQEGAL